MKKLLTLPLLVIIFSGCDPNCTASPSCIAPPDGSFQNGAINIAIYESILEEFEENSYQTLALLDSVVVHVNSRIQSIAEFYTWMVVDEGPSITSIDFFYDENSMNLAFDDFVFNNTESEFKEGGYLLTIIKKQEKFLLRIDRASQDLIDGVCNDTIDC